MLFIRWHFILFVAIVAPFFSPFLLNFFLSFCGNNNKYGYWHRPRPEGIPSRSLKASTIDLMTRVAFPASFASLPYIFPFMLPFFHASIILPSRHLSFVFFFRPFFFSHSVQSSFPTHVQSLSLHFFFLLLRVQSLVDFSEFSTSTPLRNYVARPFFFFVRFLKFFPAPKLRHSRLKKKNFHLVCYRVVTLHGNKV